MTFYKKLPPRPSNLIFGIHAVMEAIHSDKTIDRIFVRQDEPSERLKEIREEARKKEVPLKLVPEAKLTGICRTDNHQGVAAYLAEIVFQPLEEIILSVTEKGEAPFLLLLDNVTDVRNFGAIARSAECMGVHAVIIPTIGGAAINADAVKVSSGALHHLPVCREKNLMDAMLLMQAYGIQLLACTEKSSKEIYDADFSGPICLILGSEEDGISPALLRRIPEHVKIPLLGKVSSLNVAVAAGMVLSEAVRQRRNL